MQGGKLASKKAGISGQGKLEELERCVSRQPKTKMNLLYLYPEKNRNDLITANDNTVLIVAILSNSSS